MTVRARPIESCPHEACSLPWVEFFAFEVTRITPDRPLGIRFSVARCTGPAASPECKTVDRAKERTIERSHTLLFDPAALKETHVLALRLDGEFELVPRSKQRPVYYAHLAEVDPVSGDAEVLAFSDNGEHSPRRKRAK